MNAKTRYLLISSLLGLSAIGSIIYMIIVSQKGHAVGFEIVIIFGLSFLFILHLLFG
jgi:uncharacterized membrane protein (GlpM family)